MLQPAATTAFDAVAATLSSLAYLAVAFAVLSGARRDARAQVFMVIAATSALPYALSPLQWWKGSAVYGPRLLAATAVSFAVGSAALFHFSQVFPSRRPWIRAHRNWLIAAYTLPALPVAAIAWFVGGIVAQAAGLDVTGTGGLGAVVDGGAIVIAMLLALPVVFVVALVLPFASVMSLFTSWREAKQRADAPARVATFLMLVSQMGGGILSVLVLPMLHLVGVGAFLAVSIAALAYAFALLFPAAFAWAAFRGGVLNIST